MMSPCRECGRRCAAGRSPFQRVELFAGADELDRLAGDRAHRTRRRRAAVAVDPGQHDAGEIEPLVEAFRQIDRVSGRSARRRRAAPRADGGAAHLAASRIQLLVEREAAGGVEQHHVVTAEPRRTVARAAAICTGAWPSTIGKVSTLTCLPRMAELLHSRTAGAVRASHQHFASRAIR